MPTENKDRKGPGQTALEARDPGQSVPEARDAYQIMPQLQNGEQAAADGHTAAGTAGPSFPYEDIVDLPHHQSNRHPQMSMHDRAGQFSPFAALSGYGKAIDIAGKETEESYLADGYGEDDWE